MGVEVVDPGKVVHVGPEEANEVDALDYAIALLETYKWRKGKRTDDEFGKEQREGWEWLAAKEGLSLHDSYQAAVNTLGLPDSMRASIHAKITEIINRNKSLLRRLKKEYINDVEFNDNAKDVKEVIDVLKTAREEFASGN